MIQLASRELGELHNFDAGEQKMRRDKCLCSDSGVEWVLFEGVHLAWKECGHQGALWSLIPLG